jgi:hypothetical protein
MSKKSTAETLLLGKKLFEEGYNSLKTLNSTMQAMENVDITEESVSKALAMIIRTHNKLQGSLDGQTWNLENFVTASLKKVASDLINL